MDPTRHPDVSRRAIFRGLLVRSSLLCQTIPPPSAELVALAGEVTDRTKDARCMGCHQLLEPVGAAFAALDRDFTGTPPAVQLNGHAELAGSYPALPAFLDAVAGSQRVRRLLRPPDVGVLPRAAARRGRRGVDRRARRPSSDRAAAWATS